MGNWKLNLAEVYLGQAHPDKAARLAPLPRIQRTTDPEGDLRRDKAIQAAIAEAVAEAEAGD